jgi:hypothetical protein
MALQTPDSGSQNSVVPERLLPGKRGGSAADLRRLKKAATEKRRESTDRDGMDLAAKARALSSTGMQPGDIARTLRQYDVTAEQVREWLTP